MKRKLFWTRWRTANVCWASPNGWEVYRKNWLTGEREIYQTGHSQVSAAAVAMVLNSKKQ